MKKLLLLLGLALAVIGLGCGGDKATDSESGEPALEEENEGGSTGTSSQATGKIAFGVYGGMSTDELWIMNADGSGLKKLLPADPDTFAFDLYMEGPSWSPDGTRLVFFASYGTPHDSGMDLFLIDADGSDLKGLGLSGLEEGIAGSPDWSPDGSKIIFSNGDLFGESPREIHLVNVDSFRHVVLYSGAISADYPSWSPDGTRILFSAGEPDSLYAMNADGTGVVSLGVEGFGPVWSPDGKRIAYINNSQSAYELFTCAPNGTQQTRVIESPTEGLPFSGITWSPDSRKLAFGTQVMWGIYVVNADGSNLVKLTEGFTRNATSPAWSPQ